MTIKQQGGIFGRNPTFNDLTVEGTLTTSGAQSVDEINIDNVNINGNTISTTDTDGNLLLTPDGTGTVKVNQYLSVSTNSKYAPITIGASAFDPSSSGGGSSGGIRLAGGTAGSGNYSGGIGFSMQGASGNSGISGVQGTADNDQIGLAFFVHQSGTGSAASVEAAQFTYGKHLSMTGGGNVIMQSGSGIDFSATSGTGTSELFSDYEEGAWTPIFEPETGSFGSVTYDTIQGAKYTKIGNVVHIQGAVRTDAITVGTASGNVRLGGLPFTVSTYVNGQDAWASLNLGYSAAFNTNNPSSGAFKTQTTYADLFYRSSANGGSVALAVGDLGTGTNDNLIRFSGTYITD